MKIAGLCSGHDCAFAVLENGIPVIHGELERYTREKEPIGDSLEFLFKEYSSYRDIVHFSHCLDTWSGGIRNRFPKTFSKMLQITKKNRGDFFEQGHHESHAANAFFSSNFDEALIITIDGGGLDRDFRGGTIFTTFTVWEGEGNKIKPIAIIPMENLDIGGAWRVATKEIFGLSNGYPKGNQAGSVMAMGVMGNPDKYYDYFKNYAYSDTDRKKFDWQGMRNTAQSSQDEMLNIAASLQKSTEDITRSLMNMFIKKSKKKYLCLSGGVVLNSVMAGKFYDWFGKQIKDIYFCPVPYDAGLAIGSAQWVWHQILNKPRVNWKGNASPYLGENYPLKKIRNEIKKKSKKIKSQKAKDSVVLKLLDEQKIIAVFGGASESGRRALGNRSILADPRDPKMKEIINEKVKHRQWYRPFAPSILREKVKEWFVRDLDSPYMTTVLKYKKTKLEKVPAVTHFDGTGRLQTVTKKDNKWYYNFIKKWEKKSGVPILLNTSFNDREPIVETPKDAINCFMGTDIDYLYFYEAGILISKTI